jgi:hypothetical protein
MHSVGFSQQNAISSLHITNRLFFITEKECVYCAVRTDSLREIQVNFRLSRVKDGTLYVQVGLSSW